jgi:hypothetical protein
VHADNWEAFNLFVALKTQWNIMAVEHRVIYTGLNYQSIAALFSVKRISKAKQAQLFDELQIMEQAGMQVYNEVKK